ncbi:type II 3-dehydroquinate dehydratase [Prauserella cavernicola]|uniref:3-dehydroquinate dehydratase n=1 Tax=Prauserella cavernicola TaxID=2800127 RepID=A0A934QVT4_9PSEU|nr:type II 3-dehydroquinate dehydratase [Prauserella cavernicola]MBK1787470.1 type II 3-dehydroquinate dehydratase [Prauserella cavernicola]
MATENKPVVVMNGPNLNLLGLREPAIYGSSTMADVEDLCRKKAAEHGLSVEFFQSNSEGALVDRIHVAREAASAIVINAGAYGHTSVALHDALRASELPVIEVHISNGTRRESFRHHSYVTSVAVGLIKGLGIFGYGAALDFLAQRD